MWEDGVSWSMKANDRELGNRSCVSLARSVRRERCERSELERRCQDGGKESRRRSRDDGQGQAGDGGTRSCAEECITHEGLDEFGFGRQAHTEDGRRRSEGELRCIAEA